MVRESVKDFTWYYEHMDEKWRGLLKRLLAVMARESQEAENILSRYMEQMTDMKDLDLENVFRKMLEEAERAAEGAPWCEWAIKSGWPELFSGLCV